jgi:hypothetical protein
VILQIHVLQGILENPRFFLDSMTLNQIVGLRLPKKIQDPAILKHLNQQLLDAIAARDKLNTRIDCLQGIRRASSFSTRVQCSVQ